MKLRRVILNSEDRLRYITIENRTIPSAGRSEDDAMKEFLRRIDVGNISFISTDLTRALESNAESYDIKLYGRLTEVALFDNEAQSRSSVVSR